MWRFSCLAGRMDQGAVLKMGHYTQVFTLVAKWGNLPEWHNFYIYMHKWYHTISYNCFYYETPSGFTYAINFTPVPYMYFPRVIYMMYAVIYMVDIYIYIYMNVIWMLYLRIMIRWLENYDRLEAATSTLVACYFNEYHTEKHLLIENNQMLTLKNNFLCLGNNHIFTSLWNNHWCLFIRNCLSLIW